MPNADALPGLPQAAFADRPVGTGAPVAQSAAGPGAAARAAALDAALFGDNPDLAWELDPDGTVRRVNARLTAVLGYQPEEVVGHHVAEVVAPEGTETVARAFREALAGRASVWVTTMRHRDGRDVVTRATVLPLVVDGRVVGVVANSQDVTAEHRAAQRLREGQALYQLVVDQLPECVAVYVGGRCELINPAGAAMRGPGYTPADVQGHPWTEFLDPEDRDAVTALFTEIEASPPGTSRPFEHRFRWPDGRRVEVEGTATAIRLNGRPAVHCFARDVTMRRRIDADRLRAQRLAALGRLAAGVAHDFNNLLAVMLAAVEMAADALPADSPLREDLADAADAARRGRTLTRQLLTFARRQDSHPETFAVNDVVRNLTALLQRLVGSGVRLTVDLDPDAGATTADPAQVEQALMNLVTNARDALAGRGGQVAVETARDDGHVRLSVRDTGPGIPAELRPHLFEPFFTTKPEGHGLGLATVYGVVTAAGGRVEVESTPGEGATFHLYFPRVTSGAGAAGGAR